MPKVTDEHRAARREQILSAARRCVVREGFHKTTMAAVIAESGLSAGAVYGYFRSKNAIIDALVEAAVGPVGESLVSLGEQSEPVSPVDALEAVLSGLAGLQQHPDGDLSRIAVQVWAEALRNPSVNATVTRQMGQIRAGFEAVVERAQQAGSVNVSVDARTAAQVLTGLLPGYVVQRLILGDVTVDSYLAGVEGLFSRAD